ncbi:response regulator [Paenibacillus sacheonensis]|uniref:Response regulator n=1 Tax=Paenibacillus sacheonensis TaxID=742054 RepID=A0A7X4YKQ4_9BACL|nr:response regulator [Paenibacillus sacheonensis]MBM7563277.1 YesN/AraC family two-component response regulator [Paenibacillus sacheonensis]NBC68165.1 response regulator [Paenibacillus sacheonensis]
MVLRILIADDEPIERKVIEKIIADSELPAVVAGGATSGSEAIPLAEELRPDLIFMDIRMPGMNGLDAAALIQQSNPGAIIAIVTAFDEFAYAKRAIDIRLDYFLLKPIEKSEIIRIIEEAILRVQPAARAEEQVPAAGPQQIRLAREIARYVREHYAEPLSLDTLERELNRSHQYMNRAFKAVHRLPIMQFLTEHRLERAKMLLGQTDFTLGRIAEETGFYDASHLGQTFKRQEGVTPQQYRQQWLAKQRG